MCSWSISDLCCICYNPWNHSLPSGHRLIDVKGKSGRIRSAVVRKRRKTSNSVCMWQAGLLGCEAVLSSMAMMQATHPANHKKMVSPLGHNRNHGHHHNHHNHDNQDAHHSHHSHMVLPSGVSCSPMVSDETKTWKCVMSCLFFVHFYFAYQWIFNRGKYKRPSHLYETVSWCIVIYLLKYKFAYTRHASITRVLARV